MALNFYEFMLKPTASLAVIPNVNTQTLNVVQNATANIASIYEEVNTISAMNGKLTNSNIGKMYKYTGTSSGDYYQNGLYIVENNVQHITIGGTAYEAELGATWNSWIASTYNTDGYVLQGNIVMDSSRTKIVEYNSEEVMKDFLIIDNAAYTLREAYGTFTINGTTYRYYNTGEHTWQSWVESDYNTDGYVVDSRRYITTEVDVNAVVDPDTYNFVMNTDTITENTNYEIRSLPLSTFTIDGDTYEFDDETQQWESWANSDYNTDNYIADMGRNCILTNDMSQCVAQSNMPVRLSETIVENYDYSLIGNTSTFTIQGMEYQFDSDTQYWGSWIMSSYNTGNFSDYMGYVTNDGGSTAVCNGSMFVSIGDSIMEGTWYDLMPVPM